MPAARSRSNAYITCAVFLVCALAYVWLGAAVSHVPPRGIDAAARVFAGHATGIAWIFTYSCLWPVLASFAIVALIVAVRSPLWRSRALFSIIVTLAAWRTSDVAKNLFMRPRPAYWYVYHEPSFAYASGHALFAVLVYFLWAYFIAKSALPTGLRALVVPLLALWGAGVIWSRLALGAHYPSDLAGGVLLAIAMLALGSLVARKIAPRALIFARLPASETSRSTAAATYARS